MNRYAMLTNFPVCSTGNCTLGLWTLSLALLQRQRWCHRSLANTDRRYTALLCKNGST